MLLPDPATKMGINGVEYWRGKGKHVFHGSTREKKTTSTVRKYCLGKTRMLFPCGEPCVQYYDLLRDPEETATFALSLATAFL
jgi:hypothetical protein